MLILDLSNLRFYAHHGLYKEEKILGGEFEVNITIWHKEKSMPVMHIDDAIDYTKIYSLIKERMQNPTPLLETLVTTITQEILTKFSMAEEVKISITKIHPPIIAFGGSVSVSYHLKRNKK
jgi:7,8-dihydroneopterin aldolase/epimerase/oxygenase